MMIHDKSDQSELLVEVLVDVGNSLRVEAQELACRKQLHMCCHAGLQGFTDVSCNSI